MKLFSRFRQTSNIPPELRPYYANTGISGRMNTIRRIVLVAGVVIIVAALASFAWQKLSDSNDSKPGAGNNQKSESANNRGGADEAAPGKTPSSDKTNSKAVNPSSLPKLGE